MKYIVLSCLLLLSGCVSLMGRGKHNLVAPADLMNVANWKEVAQMPLGVYKKKSFWKFWKRPTPFVDLGMEVITRSDEGGSGFLFFNTEGRLFLRCVSNSSEMNDGWCEIRYDFNNKFVGGYANTLRVFNTGTNVMSFSLTDYSDGTHTVYLSN